LKHQLAVLPNTDIWATYLIFAKKWEVKNDFQWLSVGGKDYEVSKASVKGLGGLVSTLLQLYHLTKGGQQTNSIFDISQCAINSIIRKQCAGAH